MNGAEEAIHRSFAEYTAACNSGDVEAYIATLTSDAVIQPPDQPAVRGHAEIGAWVKTGFFDPYGVTFEGQFERLVVTGSDAFAPGTFTLHLVPRGGGDPIEATGAFFDVFRADSSGSWKMAYAIFNFDQAQG